MKTPNPSPPCDPPKRCDSQRNESPGPVGDQVFFKSWTVDILMACHVAMRCQWCHGVVACLGMILEYFNNMFTKCLFGTKKALVISLYQLEQNVLNTISSKMMSMIPPESNEHFEMMAPRVKMKMTTPKHLPTIDLQGANC